MICDYERLRLISRNKPDLAQQLITLFLKELPAIKGEIERASSAADTSQLTQACHRLKSAAGNFVTSDFYQEVSTLEKIAGEDQLALWQQQWQDTNNKLQTLTEELHALCR